MKEERKEEGKLQQRQRPDALDIYYIDFLYFVKILLLLNFSSALFKSESLL